MEKAIASLCGALPADVKVDVTIPQACKILAVLGRCVDADAANHAHQAMLLSQVQKRLKGNAAWPS